MENPEAAADLFLPEPLPREVKYTVISVDDHVVEPPHTFEGRFPARLQDRAPKVVDTPQGLQIWEFEGEQFTQVGMNAVAGRRPTQKMEPFRFDQMRPSCYDVDARVRDMDINGVWAAVNFPSMITGFCGRVFFNAKDPELGQACHPRVERLVVRGVVPRAPDPHHPARHRVPLRSRRRGRRDPPQRGARLHRHQHAGTPAPDRAARPVAARPLGPDHPGVCRHRHRRVAARRQLGRRDGPARRARSAARRHAVRPAVALVVRRVALVRVPGEAPDAQDRDERGRHRLGRDAPRPARQPHRPLAVRRGVGRPARRRR